MTLVHVSRFKCKVKYINLLVCFTTSLAYRPPPGEIGEVLLLEWHVTLAPSAVQVTFIEAQVMQIPKRLPFEAAGPWGQSAMFHNNTAGREWDPKELRSRDTAPMVWQLLLARKVHKSLEHFPLH